MNDLEELSKSQLILLTILVNFVTSVATGILTVSLLDHAPPFVTQTVNRVVEHTIETVAQAAPAAVVQAPAPSNQDLVTSAIAADATHLVALYGVRTGTTTPALAVATYLDKASAVVAIAQDALPKEVLIQFPDGSFVPASLSHDNGTLAIYGFANGAKLPKATPMALIPSSSLKLGETALTIGADGSASTGIVSRVGKDGVRTTLPDVGAGSAVVDLSGNLIGVALGGTPGLLVGTEAVTNLLSATTSVSAAPPAGQ